MCTLVARMVKLRNVGVTFFTISGFHDRVLAEIRRDFHPNEEHLASRIRRVIKIENTPACSTDTRWFCVGSSHYKKGGLCMVTGPTPRSKPLG